MSLKDTEASYEAAVITGVVVSLQQRTSREQGFRKGMW
jgi:hypothetical protein